MNELMCYFIGMNHSLIGGQPDWRTDKDHFLANTHMPLTLGRIYQRIHTQRLRSTFSFMQNTQDHWHFLLMLFISSSSNLTDDREHIIKLLDRLIIDSDHRVIRKHTC